MNGLRAINSFTFFHTYVDISLNFVWIHLILCGSYSREFNAQERLILTPNTVHNASLDSKYLPIISVSLIQIKYTLLGLLRRGLKINCISKLFQKHTASKWPFDATCYKVLFPKHWTVSG